MCVCVPDGVCVCASQRQWPPCGSYLDLVFRNQAETVQGGAPQDVAVLDPSPPTSTGGTSHSTVAAQRVTRSKTVMEARAARVVGGAMGRGHEGPAGAGLLNQADKGKGLGVEPAAAAGGPGEPSTTGILSGTDAPAQVRSPMIHSTASARPWRPAPVASLPRRAATGTRRGAWRQSDIRLQLYQAETVRTPGSQVPAMAQDTDAVDLIDSPPRDRLDATQGGERETQRSKLHFDILVGPARRCSREHKREGLAAESILSLQERLARLKSSAHVDV